MDGKSLSMLFALVAAWFILNRWVLPFFGVSTCMSCSSSCQPINRPAVVSPADPNQLPSESDENEGNGRTQPNPATVENMR